MARAPWNAIPGYCLTDLCSLGSPAQAVAVHPYCLASLIRCAISIATTWRHYLPLYDKALESSPLIFVWFLFTMDGSWQSGLFEQRKQNLSHIF